MRRRVAFQGERGAFSEEAVHALYGEDAEPIPLREFRDVGEAVVEGRVEAGVLPVENSIAGSVGPAYDVLAALPLRIVGEAVRPIRHCLLGVEGATLEAARRALSHPVALAQCNAFLRNHPGMEAVAVYDTAGAARHVAERGDPAVTAIASRLAAARYGLRVLVPDVQDREDNQTRFFAVVRDTADGDGAPGGPPGTVSARGTRKTAVLMETANRPGALVAVLTAFAEHGVNLTRLESRPGSEPWTYRFILEFVCDDRAAERAGLERAGAAALAFRVIGHFPPPG